MAFVVGTLSDCGLAALAPYQPLLKFRLRDVAITLSGGRVVATQPVTVRPDSSGAFRVDLVPTEHLRAAPLYDVSVVWLDAAAQFTRLDLFSIFVPEAGGLITGLRDQSWAPAHVIYQPHEPNPWPPGWVWCDSATGDLWRKEA